MARIVIDARESGTSTGRYIDKLIEHLHKLRPDHQFIIITKSHRLEFVRSIAPNFKVVESAFNEFSLGEQLGFKRQIEQLKPDLVHFGMVQQPILYRGRAVTTMHDLTTVRFKNPSKNPVIFTFKQQIYKWVNKRAARKSKFIFTPTKFVKEDVANFTHVNPKKIIVTYEAADKINEAPTAIPDVEGKRFIMYVGRPMPHKNLRRLIVAFMDVQKKYPDLYLVLAGKKDTLYESHEQYAKDRGVKNIVFTGFITDGQLRWLYERTSCYVFPSLSEGFGLPGLEAMAHGAPVASSNATCIPEVLGDSALYFDPNDVQGIGESITRVLSDKKLSEKLKSAGYKQVKKYSWDRMAQETLEVYDRALS